MKNLKNRKILIADDEHEHEIRKMIADFLNQEGFYHLYLASNSEEALTICRIKNLVFL